MPAPVEITSPATGSVLPFGKIVIEFTQPATDEYDRSSTFVISNLITNITTDVSPGYAQKGVLMSVPDLEISWTPKSSGKFLLIILIQKIVVGQIPHQIQDEGNYSSDFVCVLIELPKPGAKPLQSMVVMPFEFLSTLTPTVTLVARTTLTPSLTPTLVPSTTFTFTPTRTPSKPIATEPMATLTFTPVPLPSSPTATMVVCSVYPDERTCVANPACNWAQMPTGGWICKNK